MSRTVTAILCSLLVVFLSPLGSILWAEDGGVLKIVSSLPRTGSANAQTTSIVNGIRMAIDEAGGKAGSFTVKYEDWDDASPERGNWDPAVEAMNADKAIKDPDVVAYIGPYNSGAAKISMPKLNAANLLMISPATTWPGLTKAGIGEPNEPRVYRPTGKINFLRVVPSDDIQGSVAAKWAAELGVKKVFIVHDGELYGKGISNMFKKSAPALKLQIVGFEQIDPKSSNYKSLVTKIKQNKSELVFFGGTTQSNAGQLAKDLRSSGYANKLMVPDGCFETAFLDSAGRENLEGNTFVTFGGVPANQLVGKGKSFYETYKQKFNAEPEAYSSYAYEATKVVLHAIEKAGKKDRAAILKEAMAIKDFDGILGKWSFDNNGDTTLKVMSGSTVKEGQFSFVKVLG